MSPRSRSALYGPYDELSESFRAPAVILNRPAEWWSPPYLIDFVTAVEEIVAWTRDVRKFSVKHKFGWRSVLRDYGFARDKTGAVSRAQNPAITALDSAVLDLTTELSGSIESAPIDAATLEQIKVAAQHMLDSLRTPESLSEAFDELVRALKRPSVSSDRLSVARDYFWKLIELRGANPRELSDLIRGVIDDDLFYVQRVQFILNEREEPPTAPYRDSGDALMSMRSRIDLCRSLLLKPPSVLNNIVWLAYEHAHIPDAVLKVGPTTFFDDGFLRSLLDAGKIPEHWRDHLPVDLIAEYSGRLADNVANEDVDKFVYVRVDLGDGNYADSVRVARQITESVVNLASFAVSTGHWRLCDGFFQIINGVPAWTSPFHRSPERGFHVDASIDPTPVALKELAQKLGGNFAATQLSSENWTRIIEVLNWRERAKESEPLARIVLDVRVIESISSWTGESSWVDYLNKYHRWTWVRTQIVNKLVHIGHVATHTYWSMTDEQKDLLKSLNRRFIKHEQYGRITTDANAILLSLPQLAETTPPHTKIKRDANTLASKLSKVELLRKWCAELTDCWTLTLERSQRIRNSLAHGGPVGDFAAASVSEFVRSLSGWSVHIALEAVMAADDLEDVHDLWKRSNDEWKNRVDSANSVLDALFPQK